MPADVPRHDDDSIPEEKRRGLEAASAWIRGRRSIKPADMSERPVDQQLLEVLLENANWAPSHGQTEPWRFMVFRGEARVRLAGALQQVYRETTVEADFRPEKLEKLGRNPLLAPVVIVVVMKRQVSGKIPRIEEIEAVACAVQNLHLSAAAIGLGGYWSSPPFIYTDAMRNWLSLGSDDQCLGLFYLGWPKAGSRWPEGRRRPVTDKIEWFD